MKGNYKEWTTQALIHELEERDEKEKLQELHDKVFATGSRSIESIISGLLPLIVNRQETAVENILCSLEVYISQVREYMTLRKKFKDD